MKGDIFVRLKNRLFANSEVEAVIFKGQCIQFIELNNKKTKQAAAFQLIIKELELCELMLIKAIELYDERIKKYLLTDNKDLLILDIMEPDGFVIFSLYNSAATSYCKCFNSSNGRKVRLNERDVFKDCSIHLKKEHSEIKRYRDNYVAHAGNSEYEACRAIACLTMSPGERPISLLANATFSMKEKHEIESSLELVSFVKNQQIGRQQDRLKNLSIDINQHPQLYGVDKLHDFGS